MEDEKRTRSLKSKLGASWQNDILHEVRQIEDVLRAEGMSPEEAEPVWRHLANALDSAFGHHRDLKSLLTGAHIEAAWRSLHAARQNLLLVASPAYIRSQVPILRSKVTRYLSKGNPERDIYMKWLAASDEPDERVVKHNIRMIREAVDRESDLKFTNVRRFRNTIRLLIAGISLLLLVLIFDPPDNPWLPVCAAVDSSEAVGESADPTPAPSPTVSGAAQLEEDGPSAAETESCPVVWHLVLVGMVGGFLAGAATLRRLPATREPYGLRQEQALLKVPMGGLTGVVGTMFLQSSLLDALDPQPAPEILAYAVLFGFGQEAITRFMDKKAADLLSLGEAPSAED